MVDQTVMDEVLKAADAMNARLEHPVSFGERDQTLERFEAVGSAPIPVNTRAVEPVLLGERHHGFTVFDSLDDAMRKHLLELAKKTV